MTTDTSERGLERLICTALTGHACDSPKEGTVGEPTVGYGAVGWSCGNPYDYDREYCENCLLESLLDEKLPDYDTFLAERRRLMALKIKQWFEVLS